MKIKLKNEAIEKLKLAKEDPDQESAHVHADAILCALLVDLGYQEVVDEFKDVPKWYA